MPYYLLRLEDGWWDMYPTRESLICFLIERDIVTADSLQKFIIFEGRIADLDIVRELSNRGLCPMPSLHVAFAERFSKPKDVLPKAHPVPVKPKSDPEWDFEDVLMRASANGEARKRSGANPTEKHDSSD